MFAFDLQKVCDNFAPILHSPLKGGLVQHYKHTLFIMYLNRLIVILTLGLMSHATLAQVKGRVVDEHGEPLAGATVRWEGTAVGTTTDKDGRFSLAKQGDLHEIVTSLMGYRNDTTCIHSRKVLVIRLMELPTELSEAEVVGRKQTTLKMWHSAEHGEMITAAGLKHAACCNLGESFVSTAAVDVNYSDASTGAKQIKLLGLSGTYVQMLTENIPNFRTVSAPYGLGYVPGPWMQSIQVSKGITSVKQGYEAMTGQINIEYRKPQMPEADWLNLNLYGNSKGRIEANADATFKMKDNRWGTTLLVHYDKDLTTHDENHDGFQDMPKTEQINVMNRWSFLSDTYEFQIGARYLNEQRRSGQLDLPATENPFVIDLRTNRVEGFMKNGYMWNNEGNSSLALILSGSYHCQDNYFGLKHYDVDQSTAYASLIFENDWTKSHKLSVGLSMNYDGYTRQPYRMTMGVTNNGTADEESITSLLHPSCHEITGGGYAQYTFSLFDKSGHEGRLLIQPGVRVDYSNLWGTFVTPRVHLKWTPNDWINVRASAGKGYRTSFTLDENNFLLSSARRISMESERQREEDWNAGASVMLKPTVAGEELNITAEYYYTDFQKQAVIDMDRNPHEIHIYQLDGKSRSHVFQIEASYPFFRGFNASLAYRFTDSKTTYRDAQGNSTLRERPLTSRYKALCSLQYKTRKEKWQFDATLALNGPGRMPDPYVTDNGEWSWDREYKAFPQLNAQVTYNILRNLSIYVGGENLTNFTQKNPIIAADKPWGNDFDPTMTWGPIDGWMLYAGLRFNLARR